MLPNQNRLTQLYDLRLSFLHPHIKVRYKVKKRVER